MNAAMALERQLDAYRQMTGEERLAIALRLHELACAVAREGIRQQHPDANASEIEEHLRRRLRLAQTP
jgi:Rv0078B-related antitoxin